MHALTFDIEDWFHIVDVPELENISTWDHRPTIVEKKTNLILSILKSHEVKATFFVLGWVAEKYPDIARKIVDEGHELATHSYWHRRVYSLSPEEFRKDVRQSVEILEHQSGVKVRGFRAPSFSITEEATWAISILKEMGLEYDASLFPAKRAHGGYAMEQGPQLLDENIFGYSFPELPMSMMTIAGRNIPFSGGGYLRLWPKSIIKLGFNQLEKRNLPAVVYLHPRDFAPESPRIRMPLHRKFKSYYNLTSTEGKLKMLLENYEFTTCEDLLKKHFQTEDLSEI